MPVKEFMFKGLPTFAKVDNPFKGSRKNYCLYCTRYLKEEFFTKLLPPARCSI